MKKIITFSCIVFYATMLHAQHTGDYRSVKSGDWTDHAKVWQRYNGSNWVTASTYPTSSDGKITIQDLTTVTMNLTLTIDECTVNAGGQLDLSDNYTITLANATGDDLTVNGQLYMSTGTITGPGSIIINGLYKWSGGSLQVKGTNEGLISIDGNVNLYSTLTNNAAIDWTSQYLEFWGATLNNNGVFNALAKNYLYNSNGGTFNNNSNGIFNQNSINGTTCAVTFNNKGTMSFNEGTFLVNDGTFTNTKKLNFSGGSLENNATVNLNNGTTVTGSGNLVQSYNSFNINLGLTLPQDVALTINNGTLSGSGSLKLNSLATWNNGSINLPVTILSSSVMNIGLNEATLYSTITNNGIINWTSQYITFQGGTIINNKTFNAYGNGYLYNSNGGTFTNSSGGVFTRDVGAGNITNRISFNNAGTVNINSGEFYNDNPGIFTNTGKLNLNSGSFENESTANFNSGTSVTGKGQIINSYSSMNINLSLTIPSTVDFRLTSSSGATLAGTGSLKINGRMFWENGDINVPVTIQSTGELNINGASGLYSTITNNGKVDWVTNDIYFYGGSIINNKNFNISGNYRLYKYTSGSFTNSSTGIITKNSLGTTTATVTVNNAGTIAGVGTFDFGTSLNNTGTFDPGIDNATGILATSANYKNKILNIKITGVQPGLKFDRLIVNGKATLSGSTLNVTASGNIPAGAYVIVSCTGKRTGTFATTNLPSGYTVTYNSNEAILNVPEDLAHKNAQKSENMTAKKIMDSKLLSVFPNPATENINITYQSKNKTASLKVFDGDGKVVLQKNISPSASNNININKLPSGTYFIQINDGMKTQSAKFIKQ